MGKIIKTFVDFINEEISDDYLDKQIDKARSQDKRYISQGYEQNLRSKQNTLKDADNQRQEKAASEAREQKNRKLANISDILNNKLENKTWNLGNYGDTFVKVIPGNGMLRFDFMNSTGAKALEVQCNIERDNIEVYDIEKDTNRKSIISIQRVEQFFVELQKMYREYFPESRYADRKIWSSLD